ncbi:MAG: SEL1-like repeat protein [Candidatus Hydrogenedentes bacterium]|nr:SEL1-like repeat protein [Candidatus Hydrogenedentota bacterium]
MISLAEMYVEGRGVKRDKVLAYAWYTVAMEKGNEQQRKRAEMKRDRLVENGIFRWFFGMTGGKIREAEELARSYKEGQLLKRKS